MQHISFTSVTFCMTRERIFAESRISYYKIIYNNEPDPYILPYQIWLKEALMMTREPYSIRLYSTSVRGGGDEQSLWYNGLLFRIFLCQAI